MPDAFTTLAESVASSPRSHAQSAAALGRIAALGRALSRRVLLSRRILLGLRGCQRGLDPGPGALEERGAHPRQFLAALPQSQRLVQAEPAGLQRCHDLGEFVPGLLVARAA